MKKRFLSAMLAAILLPAALPPAQAVTTATLSRYDVIASSGLATIVLGADGNAYGMGQSWDIGISSKAHTYTPVKVAEGVKSVSGGNSDTAVLKTDNTLWDTAGTDHFIYQASNVAAVGSTLNVGSAYIQADGTVDLNLDATSIYRLDPKHLENVAGLSMEQRACALLKSDGSLWTWGSNAWMGLGYVTPNLYYFTNTPAKILDNVIDMEMGEGHCAAIQADGSLWTWGNGRFGQLFAEYPSHVNLAANTIKDYYDIPRKVADNVVDVSVGYRHTAVLKADGSLWMCGENKFGQVGSGPETNGQNVTTPVKVLDNVAAVACGTYYTVAVKWDGTVWAWGWNQTGALGLGMNGGNTTLHRVNCQDVPKQVPRLVAAVPDRVTLTIPENTAYTSAQTVLVDGKPVELQAYALKDANGNDTNYVKLRDVAYTLNGTAAQFAVDWDGTVRVTTGTAYTPNGTEMSTPFYGNRVYTVPSEATVVDGTAADLDAILLQDDQGSGYTYYKLRDLGKALGFNVTWSAELGIQIQTDRPYTGT